MSGFVPGGGVGLIQTLVFAGFVLALVLPSLGRSHRDTPDKSSHRRLMRELRRHE